MEIVNFHSLNGIHDLCKSASYNKTITLNCLSVMRINIYIDYFANKC